MPSNKNSQRLAFCVTTVLIASLAQSSNAFSSTPPARSTWSARPLLQQQHQQQQTNNINYDYKIAQSMTSSVHSENNSNDGYAVWMMSSTGDDQQQMRSRLRRATGFSLTAFRRTMRIATGISLTAIYASAFAATSKLVRVAMTLLLSPLPAWFRYFLQPFLILYYAPLLILRNLAGPTGKRARESHDIFVDSFKSAVVAAEKKADGYWPVHVNENGEIVSVDDPKQSANANKEKVDVNQGIQNSVDAMNDDMENNSASS